MNEIEHIYIPFDLICEYRSKGGSESLRMKGDGVSILQNYFETHPKIQIHLYARNGEYPSQYTLLDILKCLGFFKIACVYGMNVFSVDWKHALLVCDPTKYRPSGVPVSALIPLNDFIS